MKSFEELGKEAGLNRSQKKFCKMPVKKNIRLLAPAGAGKTFSLLWRCKFIAEEAKKKGEAEPKFLIISFTKSAKLELENRIKEPAFKGINATIRTFNSWGWEQIKRPGKELISNQMQKSALIKHDLQPILKKYPHISDAVKSPNKIQKAADVIDLMDLLKSLGFTHYMNRTDYKANEKVIKELGLFPILEEGYEKLYLLEGVQSDSPKVKEERVKEFFEFWKKAVIYLDSVARFTFEDQKYWARIYFETQIAEKKSPSGITRYTHIMVDEFQDINPLDMLLLRSASIYHGQKGKKTTITVLGDDDQAIFGWRGSTPKYILHPETYFETDFSTCVLDINYRSPKDIVELSNKLLSYNRDRVPKEIRSAAKGKANIKVVRTKKVGTSIDATMKIVNKLLTDDRFQSIALIGRRQTTLFPYQVLLGADKVPYFIDIDMDIYAGEAMQSLLNIIQIVYRAKDNDVDDPINSLIAILDKVGRYELNSKEKSDISDYLIDGRVTSFDVALNYIKNYPEKIKKNMCGEEAYQIIRNIVDAETVYDFMEMAIALLEGLEKDYTKKEQDLHYKEPQFFRLKEISKKYGKDFRKFYRDIDMAKMTVAKINSDPNKAANMRVHLMTATRSKGHEYDAVIILDADDGVWPDRQSVDIEEERRLFHVALSRAKKNLYFVTSDDRLESRFLLEARLI